MWKLVYSFIFIFFQVKAIDKLHEAAYRNGLGNSLFCGKHNVGKVTPETLLHYVCENFTSNKGAVIGLGINHDELVAYAKNMTFPEGQESKESSKFHAGEIR